MNRNRKRNRFLLWSEYLIRKALNKQKTISKHPYNSSHFSGGSHATKVRLLDIDSNAAGPSWYQQALLAICGRVRSAYLIPTLTSPRLPTKGHRDGDRGMKRPNPIIDWSVVRHNTQGDAMPRG